MSIKSLSKTRWKLETDRVTIYPYGLFYIFAGVVAVAFTGILFVYLKYQNTTVAESLPLVLFILIFVLLFWGYAATYIEFDNSKARMRKMLMGFIPVNTIPFSKLQGINSVSNMAGSYNYRLFRKDARYGKGIIVSSGYTRNDDVNAIAFVEEAVPVIHGYLDLHDSPADHVPEQITSYRFFDQQGATYSIKNKKIGAIIFGIIFLAIGGYLLTTPTDGLLAKIFIVGAMLFLGMVFFNAAFTKITFDTATQSVQRTGLVSFFNRQYQFQNFAGIQTLRRSINFVYAGTDINMYFNVPGKNDKQDLFTVISLKKSTDIERFIQELYQIMEQR